MHGSKLLETLSFFTPEEILRLDQFLRSPYFIDKTVPAEVYPLFQYINSYAANPEHPKLKKEQVYQFLFPKTKFIGGKVDKLMSALLKQINRYIGIHFNEFDHSMQEQLAIVQFYQKRNARNFANHYAQKIKRNFEKITQKDREYYFKGFQLALAEFQSNKLQVVQDGSIDSAQSLLPLDIFYLISKLENACFLLHKDYFRKPLDTSPIIEFMDKAKELFASRGLLEIPLVKVYYQTYELLKSDSLDNKLFLELQERIKSFENEIPFKTIKLFSDILRNFSIRRYNLGAINALEEVFDLHKDHLEKGYLTTKTGILTSVYKNMVTLGLRTEAYDWVWQFMEDYKNKLEGTEFPKEVYQFNLANYYFAKKDYDQAINLLSHQYEDLYYKIASKRLELKVYYESQSKILPSKIDAFKLYIFRLPKSEILDHKKKSNNNFINLLRQISNKKAISTKAKIQKLIQKTEEAAMMTEKVWLLKKLRALL